MDIQKIKPFWVLLPVFILLVLINSTTVFWSDDYCRVLTPDWSLSAISAKANNEYLTWTGRYLVTILTYFFINFSFYHSPIVFSVLNSAVSVLLIMIMARLALGMSWFELRGRHIFVATFFLLLGVSAFGEVALWKTGSIGYLWVVTAGLFLLVPLVEGVFGNGPVYFVRQRNFLPLALLAAFASLGLENFSITIVGCYFSYLAWSFFCGGRKKEIVLLAIVFLILLLCVMAMIFSPGNYERTKAIQQVSGGGGFARYFEFGKAFLSVYFNSWVTYLFIILFLIEKNVNCKHRALLFLVLSVISLLIMGAAPGVQTGGRKNFASEVFLLIATLGLFYSWIDQRFELSKRFFVNIYYGVGLAMVGSVALLIVFNFQNLKVDKNRQEIIDIAKRNGVGMVALPPLEINWYLKYQKNKNQTERRLFFFAEFAGDGGACYSRAYGLDSVRLEGGG